MLCQTALLVLLRIFRSRLESSCCRVRFSLELWSLSRLVLVHFRFGLLFSQGWF